MIKVLHVLSAVNIGGIENMLFNYYRHFDKDRVSFDFCAHKTWGGALGERLQKLGCKVFYITSQRQSISKNQRDLAEILQNNHYHVIHFHHGLFSLGVKTAKKYAPQAKIIVHSHSAKKLGFPIELIKPSLRRRVIRYADYYCACGLLAAKACFGKTLVKKGLVRIIPNAIEVDSCLFDANERQKVREQYLIKDDEKVVGIVGRMTTPKNPFFIVKVVQRLSEICNTFRVLWVGDGELYNRVKAFAKERGVADKIIFVGGVENAKCFYSAFDVFILPSLYEGFPVVAIEAQCNGVPTILSEKITREAALSSACRFVVLDEKQWCNAIFESLKSFDRSNAFDFQTCGFDVRIEAKKLMAFYEEIAKDY